MAAMESKDSARAASAAMETEEGVRGSVQEECISIDKSEPYILGIDEAGRGPVLGPMVYGTCWCPKSKSDLLRSLGFADSKTLTEEQRERLFALIKKTKELAWAVDVISSEDISDKMLRRHKQSLNHLSHMSAAGLIQKALDQGYNIAEAYVDTVGPPDSYRAKLERFFPSISFTVCSKADSKFPIVSAASICAKVTRDHELDGWQYKEKKDFDSKFGCGYPGDEDTKAWLRRNIDPVFGFPSLVRFSWATAKNLLQTDACKVEWGLDDDAAQPALTSFFSSKPGPQLKDRFGYFERAGMNVVQTM